MGTSLSPLLTLLSLLSGPWLELGNGQMTNMVQLPGGRFQMGTNSPDGRDGEGPVREVMVKPFAIDIFPVTNKDFREFVREKKYQTEAEVFGWSFVFEDLVSDELRNKATQKMQSLLWWLPVERAFWRQGKFPKGDKAEDGFHGVSPVNAFPPQNNYVQADHLGSCEQPHRDEESPPWHPWHSLATCQTQPNSGLRPSPPPSLWQTPLPRAGKDPDLHGGAPLSPGEGAHLTDCVQEPDVSLRGQILTVWGPHTQNIWGAVL
uniref:Inactive C-alpha-formylglycine-generating enzyme 2 isoform X4 n=1 Tax=Tursiops truncatus TaxID=9739 RepID=A0A6J3Q327_TURTR|nr:inactive C-alpha-formylglycine-generating enzyme 2 isoform X4 [Tursiops truncatus]